MANFLFYLVGIGAVLFAVGVVVARNPIMSVLSLLGSFFCLAAIYLLAGFQFMAAAQLLVYAGAIMVLFLFVIMLLNLGDPESWPTIDSRARRRLALPLGISGALLLVGMIAVKRGALAGLPQVKVEGPVEDLGFLTARLFSRYTLPFEAAGLLLLAATLGVLVLAKRERGPGPALDDPELARKDPL